MLTLSWLVQVEFVLLVTYTAVDLIQGQLRNRGWIAREQARRTQHVIDHYRRRAASNASLALSVTGERARRYHRTREAELAREADRLEAVAHWWASRAQRCQSLQR